MQPQRSDPPRVAHRAARPLLASLGALTVVALLTSSSFAGAAAPGSVTLHAPYKGTHSDRAYSLSLAGCGKGKVAKLPFFYQKNGTAGFEDLARTAKCKIPGDNAAQAESSIKVLVPLSFASNGSHSIVVNWHVNATTRASARLGSCVLNLSSSISYCLQIVEAYLDGYATLYDGTTGASTYPSNFWVGVSNASIQENEHTSVFYNYSSSNPGISHVDLSVASWFNATGLVTTHRYWLILDFSGAAVCEFSTLHAQIVGGGVGDAQLNFATLGRGAVLNSITVS